MQIINIFCLLVLLQFTKTGARDDIDFICSKLGYDGKYLKTAFDNVLRTYCFLLCAYFGQVFLYRNDFLRLLFSFCRKLLLVLRK